MNRRKVLEIAIPTVVWIIALVVMVWALTNHFGHDLEDKCGNWPDAFDLANFMRHDMGSETGATLDSIRLLIDDTSVSGDVRVAIYTSQGTGVERYPYEVVWGDNTGKAVESGNDHWMDWTTSAEDLTASATYWLGWVLENTGNAIAYANLQPARSHRWRSLDFTDDWPSSYPTTGWSYNDNRYIMQAWYSYTEEEAGEGAPIRRRIGCMQVSNFDNEGEPYVFKPYEGPNPWTDDWFRPSGIAWRESVYGR
jgi:hypothetical protein